MKKIFQFTTMAIALLCFGATVILLIVSTQASNPDYLLYGVITFFLMWIFSVLNNFCYENED